MQAGLLSRGAVGLMFAAGVLHGQIPSEGRIEFEVASVKPAGGPGKGEPQGALALSPNLTLRNVSLWELILTAYGIKDYQLSGPDWMKYERYDVTARAAATARANQIRAMLAALLAERFKLTVHRDTKDFTVDALVVGKNGPKIGNSQPEGPSRVRIDRGKMSFQNFSMARLADYLSQRSPDRPIVDATEIDGYFDFSVPIAELESDDPVNMKRAMEQAMRDGSLARIIAEQIGLKLETRKGPTEIVVVDHAARTPAAN